VRRQLPQEVIIAWRDVANRGAAQAFLSRFRRFRANPGDRLNADKTTERIRAFRPGPFFLLESIKKALPSVSVREREAQPVSTEF
jgi:hypothetical protein